MDVIQTSLFRVLPTTPQAFDSNWKGNTHHTVEPCQKYLCFSIFTAILGISANVRFEADFTSPAARAASSHCHTTSMREFLKTMPLWRPGWSRGPTCPVLLMASQVQVRFRPFYSPDAAETPVAFTHLKFFTQSPLEYNQSGFPNNLRSRHPFFDSTTQVVRQVAFRVH